MITIKKWIKSSDTQFDKCNVKIEFCCYDLKNHSLDSIGIVKSNNMIDSDYIDLCIEEYIKEKYQKSVGAYKILRILNHKGE